MQELTQRGFHTRFSRLPASFPGVGRYGDQVVRRVTFSTQRGGRRTSDFDVANSIKLFQTRESSVDSEITTGKLDRMLIGKDLVSPAITVAGLFGELRIGRDYTIDPNDRSDIIEASGPDGTIGSVVIGRHMRGDIVASSRIGPPRTVRGQKTGRFIVNDVVLP